MSFDRGECVQDTTGSLLFQGIDPICPWAAVLGEKTGAGGCGH